MRCDDRSVIVTEGGAGCEWCLCGTCRKSGEIKRLKLGYGPKAAAQYQRPAVKDCC